MKYHTGYFVPKNIYKYKGDHTRKKHRYLPDFYAKLKTKDGEKKFIFEVKPKSLFKKKKTPKRITKKFLREMAEIEINNNKWKAAKAFCERYGWSFQILTDDNLKRFRI